MGTKEITPEEAVRIAQEKIGDIIKVEKFITSDLEPFKQIPIEHIKQVCIGPNYFAFCFSSNISNSDARLLREKGIEWSDSSVNVYGMGIFKIQQEKLS